MSSDDGNELQNAELESTPEPVRQEMETRR